MPIRSLPSYPRPRERVSTWLILIARRRFGQAANHARKLSQLVREGVASCVLPAMSRVSVLPVCTEYVLADFGGKSHPKPDLLRENNQTQMSCPSILLEPYINHSRQVGPLIRVLLNSWMAASVRILFSVNDYAWKSHEMDHCVYTLFNDRGEPKNSATWSTHTCSVSSEMSSELLSVFLIRYQRENVHSPLHRAMVSIWLMLEGLYHAWVILITDSEAKPFSHPLSLIFLLSPCFWTQTDFEHVREPTNFWVNQG